MLAAAKSGSDQHFGFTEKPSEPAIRFHKAIPFPHPLLHNNSRATGIDLATRGDTIGAVDKRFEHHHMLGHALWLWRTGTSRRKASSQFGRADRKALGLRKGLSHEKMTDFAAFSRQWISIEKVAEC